MGAAVRDTRGMIAVGSARLVRRPALAVRMAIAGRGPEE
jgi:hypothetical protein